ncbi:flagellar motor switch protein FliG [Paenirhodobacter enshiensis]|uniref:Flagellar motor switch protein FliG n=1 Tax=Paenirhodobacter enshiensis TaxID=1105367 RepID=A0A086XWX8_9RHOB|nr:FliG C-terminal domain-containing protein [Paenirhodobacter enshiensis]KFI26528.1 flagellar motor switch protein FliG [Paenirhodobacter enshiensis]
MTVIARKGAGEQFSVEGNLRPMLSPRQKAAVIVRLLASEGVELPLATLSDEIQTLLAGQMTQMRPVDRDTLNEIVEEFCSEIERIGLTFPDSLDKALSLLDGHLSTTAASRLRRMVSSTGQSDPWERIAELSGATLAGVLSEESVEVGAVMLSKLPIGRAAELLGQVPGEKARALAYAVSLTGNIAPEVVLRIGVVLLQQLDAVPARAFEEGPVERVGAILNQSASAVRDSVLEGLEEQDRGFADQVRKAIFTFALIPQRIEPRDVPKILRAVDQSVLITALAAATAPPETGARDFILANISQRMAESLREEMSQREKTRPSEAEAAQNEIVTAIRDLEASGEIRFAAGDEE